ncbi:MAG: helix-turn-helix transcriptional regulator [Clostridium sp.]|jgi:putative transcriptional regulator|uniref:helix-turn-helix domain-containing protein n=1 Tax=Clostridium sp. TaxID=1506 RepID=UPI0028FE1125|nr:helix-turn-helix transcriptional regulator [Clostridium sp.]MDU1096421.1 helix-turn-helix transcriptional regulator [Clostridioides difficile]MDU1125161.1 helix-turn-helix transcriptional regulator [Clostridium sp.]MDU3676172.1 helix-turn-helix transcriptional regulator [Clostridium sp.]MDU6874014.1 helix-turn-helix transcriptional regulator [Clostridium sp.]MDU6935041.1 helix-turn-helix transcriptional regulator [Clostridium sp.]
MIKMKLHIKLAEFKMNQKELSEKTGISKNTIGAYCNETNKHIVKEHLDIFCKLFDCKVEDIVEYVKED